METWGKRVSLSTSLNTKGRKTEREGERRLELLKNIGRSRDAQGKEVNWVRWETGEEGDVRLKGEGESQGTGPMEVYRSGVRGKLHTLSIMLQNGAGRDINLRE